MAAALWIVFVALLVIIGAFLLGACAIRPVGLLSNISFLFPNYYRQQPSFDGDPIRHAEAAIRSRQVALIRKAASCPKSCPAPWKTQPAMITPPPPTRSEGDDLRRRAQERGARTGRLQITLAWFSTDDLDLFVECPGGRLSQFDRHTGPGICGDGTIDLDANRHEYGKGYTSPPTTTPVENAVWQTNVPSGTYRVEVFPNWTHTVEPISYRVAVKLDDEERICTGTVHGVSTTVKGQAEYAITFMPTHPLPDCTNTTIVVDACSEANHAICK
jgi:hypothetical protein